jgi:hypothetical protein
VTFPAGLLDLARSILAFTLHDAINPAHSRQSLSASAAKEWDVYAML